MDKETEALAEHIAACAALFHALAGTLILKGVISTDELIENLETSANGAAAAKAKHGVAFLESAIAHIAKTNPS